MNSLLIAFLVSGPQQKPQLPAGGKSVIRVPKMENAPLNFLKAAAGYKVSLFADNLRHPRMMAVSPNGDVFVVQTRLEVKERKQPNSVVVLSGGKKTTWADSLNLPFGIQFGFGHLYVANTGSVVRWPYSQGQTQAMGKPETVISGIPDLGYRNHWTRNILFDSNQTSLFLTIGSEHNLAEEGKRRAVIERFPLNSNGLVNGPAITYASGMRNPIGLAINPASGQLWANVAERDYKGDDLVPDYLTSVKPGGFYGWPYAYIGKHHDPRMPRKPAIESTTIVPDVLFPAHSTPIDVKFIAGGAVIALHGSQNRSKLNGYKVVFIPFDAKGRPTGPARDFVTGWLPKGSNREIYGRPAGLAIQADSSILIADDWGGKIWRVQKQ